MSVTLLPGSDAYRERAENLCQLNAFTLSDCVLEAGFQLVLDGEGLQLFNRSEPKQKPIKVDFVGGANDHRRKYGGGKGQAIAKAVGIKGAERPSVIDGTAGLGKDAFVLAGLGCSVTLVERHPVVRALLQDGLERAWQDPQIGEWMQERMLLSEHLHIRDVTDGADVVFLDPMYPHREKSALVKKDMRAFQSLVGSDLDADELYEPAIKLADKRVVVKRPDYAEPLAGVKPTMSIDTKKNRFDVYVKAAMNQLVRTMTGQTK